ncbi:hypothetical protein OIV83_000612 [Microbotryomycetes sp. JL201]|nr:hypothetical protein OIV83_000612 [Microbotryomycetes sp. JL201]
MVTVEVPSRLPPPRAAKDFERGHVACSIEKRLQTLSVEGKSNPSCVQSSLRPSSPAPSSVYSAYVHGSTTPDLESSHGAFQVVVENLRERMHDWKGHSIEEFGALRLFDHLVVRKQANLRQFIVYLFEEAVLFVADDKSKGFAGKIVDNLTGDRDKLRLKGRMSEDAMEEFVLIFSETSTLELWKTQLEHLIGMRQQNGQSTVHSSIIASPRSKSGMSTSKSTDTFPESKYSTSSRGHLSSFSGMTRTTTSSAPISKVIYEEEGMGTEFGQYARPMHMTLQSPNQLPLSPPAQVSPHPVSEPRTTSPLLDSRDFPSLDLMLILSVSNYGPSSLKSSILRSCLDFIPSHVGRKTRLSLVVFSSGEGDRGSLLKTPFISIGTKQGFQRFERIINDIGRSEQDEEGGTRSRQSDGGFVQHQEERVNVVTACNVALDIVLQRKAKSALTGMILMGDGRDGAQKQHMDLVLARAEAASVPIHALGWGKAHDPAALWMLANHTGGTYTIASVKTQLHIAVPEKRWFKIRKVSGSPQAIVSSEGTDVDVEIGELRYGEKKELLIEVDMTLTSDTSHGDALKGVFGTPRAKNPSALTNATDAFFYSQTGINPSSFAEYSPIAEYSPTNLYEEDYDGFPDEVPVLQVNASYRDPVAGKTVSRLSPTPKLLTITVVPVQPVASNKRPSVPAPDIVRRRMELLSSDMLSRSLSLMNRRQDAQAKRLLDETDRIIATIYSSLQLSAVQSPPTTSTSLTLLQSNEHARKTLQACSEAVKNASEACVDRLQFDQLVRYSAAHLSLVLRDQKSWTNKSQVEELYWTTDVCRWMVGKSLQWVETR